MAMILNLIQDKVYKDLQRDKEVQKEDHLLKNLHNMENENETI